MADCHGLVLENTAAATKESSAGKRSLWQPHVWHPSASDWRIKYCSLVANLERGWLNTSRRRTGSMRSSGSSDRKESDAENDTKWRSLSYWNWIPVTNVAATADSVWSDTNGAVLPGSATSTNQQFFYARMQLTNHDSTETFAANLALKLLRPSAGIDSCTLWWPQKATRICWERKLISESLPKGLGILFWQPVPFGPFGPKIVGFENSTW